jgi:hypothetical protein
VLFSTLVRLTTPVALIIFNRPQLTQAVFERIRQAQPQQLFIIADAPRPHHASDRHTCAVTRAIVQKIDWDCQVVYNFAEQNLGCRSRISSGIDWVFAQVPEAIILEDDCLPHPSFFRFCQALLERYRHEPQVMHISGSCYLPNRPNRDSYYFSEHPHCWGWATWQRAWQYFDVEMAAWPNLRDQGWLSQRLPPSPAATWQRNFDHGYQDRDIWDFQWTLACWLNKGLSIVPALNLIANLGFSEAATHTFRPNRFANMPTYDLAWPLQHPDQIHRNQAADAWTQYHVFDESLLARVRRKLPHRLAFGV